MKKQLRNSFRSGLALSLPLLFGAALSGCSGSGSDGVTTFAPKGTQRATAAASPVVVSGKLMVYLASEALSGVGGTNFNAANGDGDTSDDCAVVVDMVAGSETELHVATLSASIVGNDVYLIVSEAADSKDWNVDADTTDTVLLHYSAALPLAFVSTIATGTHSWAVAGGRLYFVRDSLAGLVNGDSTLAFVTAAAPTTPATVLHSDVANTLDVRVLSVDEGLIFLTADETVEGRDLNGDADSSDPFVLALLDGTDVAGVIQDVSLSVKDASTPVRARATVAGDWVVGFLVNEATQSNFATGLNDPVGLGFSNAWRPNSPAAGCGLLYADTDQLDQVLHILSYALWSAAPLVNLPENTGIPGSDRVLCTATAVATLAKESDDGGCDLNNDGDLLDEILRWSLVATPDLPFGNSAQLNAVQVALPGGAKGISDLSNKWICVVTESGDNTDFDGGGLTHDLVAWLNPNAGAPTWVFDHNPAAGGIQPAGASALSDRPERDRLLVAFQESVINQDINGDADVLDSAPTAARFDPSNANDFDFPGPAVATVANNPGIVIANGFMIYRVDEAADNRDWNGDTVKNDFVIFRTSLTTNFSALVGSGVRSTTNNLGGPSVISAGTLGAAFIADESMAAFDLNGDGRADGFVVTWFRIG
ncbi:MAG: hypothetical protein ABI054_09540 [Planctomycetota bacterium]